MKYYAIGMILLTILSVEPTTTGNEGGVEFPYIQQYAYFYFDRSNVGLEINEHDLAFTYTEESIRCVAQFEYDPYYEVDSVLNHTKYLTANGVNLFEESIPGDSDFDKNVPIERPIGHQVTFEITVFSHATSKVTSSFLPNCDSGTPLAEDGYKADLYIFPISGQYQLAEFTGKDGDQFEMTPAELAANTLTIHHKSYKMDFALDAPLDTANHRWLYEYFDEYGYDRTNHLEVQQSNITASVDSFGVTSRFKMSGLEIDNNTFQEANLRLLITLEQGENDQQLLAMAIEDTPFSFVFERIGDASSSSSIKKRVTRR